MKHKTTFASLDYILKNVRKGDTLVILKYNIKGKIVEFEDGYNVLFENGKFGDALDDEPINSPDLSKLISSYFYEYDGRISITRRRDNVLELLSWNVYEDFYKALDRMDFEKMRKLKTIIERREEEQDERFSGIQCERNQEFFGIGYITDM